jgi:hypothetical protein
MLYNRMVDLYNEQLVDAALALLAVKTFYDMLHIQIF